MSSTPPTEPTSTSSNPSDNIIDTTPFLSTPSLTRNHQTLRGAARFLRRASGRRMNMPEPSVLVRETAAEQVEERQSDWAYSKPVVILDILWNFAFVGVSFSVLVLSRSEMPSMPLRFWIVGYVLQCVLHMVCVTVEYRRRRRSEENNGSRSEQYVSLSQFECEGSTSSVAKHLESANTVFSFVWWIIGFYWVSTGGQTLADSSPQLYWLCIIFLGFDVFFVVFCVALACVIGIAVCCCLPCIIAILYAMSDQEGASKEDIDQLAKYKFRKISDNDKLAGDLQGPLGGIMTQCGTDSSIEHVLSEEDADCCICLSSYEDEVELRELPCGHHFHCTCIDKWLHINATCPLCKYNILKSTCGREEV